MAEKKLNPNKIVYLQDKYEALPKERKESIEEEVKYYETLYALREEREKLGYTQEDLSQKTGIPRETINRIESGRRNVTLDKLLSIASAMKLEIKFVPAPQ
jgi:DNA-binding XRE family transcriptional regulator